MRDEESITEFFQSLEEFRAVVEATASYEWLVKLIEPLVDKVIFARPKKLRVIAESTRKSDKLDAQVLADFLALDMVPTSYRPSSSQIVPKHHPWSISSKNTIPQYPTRLRANHPHFPPNPTNRFT